MVSPLFGPYGKLSPGDGALVRDAGGNAAFFHGFDPELFDLCHRDDLAPCVEFKTLRVNFDQYPQLIPTGSDGKPIRYAKLVQGICLSRQDYLQEVEETLRAGMATYQPAGVWLDYLTYAGWFEEPEPDLQENCFCRDCIDDFCRAIGVDAGAPREILERNAADWTNHKCRRIAALGRRYANIIKSAHPECLVGAYMCPYTPVEFDGALGRIFGQDYRLLADSIDVFTPLIYATKSGRAPSWGREFLQASPQFVPAQRKVQLILDALDFPALVEETAQASVPTWGFQLFAGAALFQDNAKRSVIQQAIAAISRQLTR